MSFDNFDKLADRYGEVSAYGVLEQIERAARINPHEMTGFDPETRLANAIHAQNEKAKKSNSCSFKKVVTANKAPSSDHSIILLAA